MPQRRSPWWRRSCWRPVPCGAAAKPDPLAGLPVHPEWGTITGKSGVLKQGCKKYTYSWSITPPEGIWALEVFITGPGVKHLAAGAYMGDYDPKNGTGTYKLCFVTTQYGTFKIEAKLSTDNGSGKITEGRLPPPTTGCTDRAPQLSQGHSPVLVQDGRARHVNRYVDRCPDNSSRRPPPRRPSVADTTVRPGRRRRRQRRPPRVGQHLGQERQGQARLPQVRLRLRADPTRRRLGARDLPHRPGRQGRTAPATSSPARTR